jgi:hypothetical protein
MNLGMNLGMNVGNEVFDPHGLQIVYPRSLKAAPENPVKKTASETQNEKY